MAARGERVSARNRSARRGARGEATHPTCAAWVRDAWRGPPQLRTARARVSSARESVRCETSRGKGGHARGARRARTRHVLLGHVRQLAGCGEDLDCDVIHNEHAPLIVDNLHAAQHLLLRRARAACGSAACGLHDAQRGARDSAARGRPRVQARAEAKRKRAAQPRAVARGSRTQCPRRHAVPASAPRTRRRRLVSPLSTSSAIAFANTSGASERL